VAPTWVASALISRSLLAQSCWHDRVSLDSGYGYPSVATHLYESCGFQIVKRDTVYLQAIQSFSVILITLA
jgi:hypothetical protein